MIAQPVRVLLISPSHKQLRQKCLPRRPFGKDVLIGVLKFAVEANAISKYHETIVTLGKIAVREIGSKPTDKSTRNDIRCPVAVLRQNTADPHRKGDRIQPRLMINLRIGGDD